VNLDWGMGTQTHCRVSRQTRCRSVEIDDIYGGGVGHCGTRFLAAATGNAND